MFYLDLTHTSHCAANSGIQRVCRGLYKALSLETEITPICYDPHGKLWRKLEKREEAQLSVEKQLSFSQKRKGTWTWWQRKRGYLCGKRIFQPWHLNKIARGLILPELFSRKNFLALNELKMLVRGPKVAIFHDAIALKLPEMTPEKTVVRFPYYMKELSTLNGVAAISEYSKEELLGYWQWLGVKKPPPVVAIPLGSNFLCQREAMSSVDHSSPKKILFVGTIEGRKNHKVVLQAAKRLWNRGFFFELHFIGGSSKCMKDTLTEIHQLQAANYPLFWEGSVGDRFLRKAYESAYCTIYPSLLEGFGLPVLESLHYGKPCICSTGGALKERTAEGGCLLIDPFCVEAIASGIEQLLTDEILYSRLCQEAVRRTFKSEADYARELLQWVNNL